MSELINHLQQIPVPIAMAIATFAFAAQIDFRVSRQERRRRTSLDTKETRESSS